MNYKTIYDELFNPPPLPKCKKEIDNRPPDDNRNFKQFKKLDVLDECDTAKIYLATPKNYEKKDFLLVIKVVYKDTHEDVEIIYKEVVNLARVQGENIITLYDFFQTKKKAYILMEYAPGGDLYDYQYDEYQVKDVMRQACKAIQICHKNNIIHRDLKLENFVFTAKNEIKLIDFGCSVQMKPNYRFLKYIGTTEYMSPQVIEEKPYGSEVDVWGLAVLLFEMLADKTPFYAKKRRIKELKIKLVRYEFPEDFPEDAKNLIKKVFKYNPKDRINLQQFMDDKYFDDIDDIDDSS